MGGFEIFMSKDIYFKQRVACLNYHAFLRIRWQKRIWRQKNRKSKTGIEPLTTTIESEVLIATWKS